MAQSPVIPEAEPQAAAYQGILGRQDGDGIESAALMNHWLQGAEQGAEGGTDADEENHSPTLPALGPGITMHSPKIVRPINGPNGV